MLEALECASCIVIFSKSQLVMPSIRLAYACLLKQDLISLVQSLLVGQMCVKEVDSICLKGVRAWGVVRPEPCGK
jgi:hypothetical protein